MTEIEKLYENAGIEKDWKPLPYGDIEEYYPEFTAEKQLELIKFLYYIDDCRETEYREFDEALAELINLYWENLTDQEKEEIRNILK